MKIKEAVKIINNTTSTVSAEEANSYLHIYHRDRESCNDWFLAIPTNATNWGSICKDWDCLFNIDPKDLARVMDVIQRLLDTPVNKRFPEKKYHLRWFNGQNGFKNYLDFDSDGDWELWSSRDDAQTFTESELEQLKKNNPHLAPAIDAMKEPAEGKDE